MIKNSHRESRAEYPQAHVTISSRKSVLLAASATLANSRSRKVFSLDEWGSGIAADRSPMMKPSASLYSRNQVGDRSWRGNSKVLLGHAGFLHRS